MKKGRSNLGVSAAGVIGAGVITVLIGLVGPILARGLTDTFTIGDLLTTPLGLSITATFISTSILMGLYIAPLQAALQRRAPAKLRSRIMAASTFSNAVFAIPGSLSILFVTRTSMTPEAAFFGVGIGMLIIGGVMIWRRAKLSEGLYEEALAAFDAKQTS